MRQLSEHLVCGIPGLLVVDKDARYSRRIVLDTLALIPGAIERPYLEWTMSKGWSAGGQRVGDMVERSGQHPGSPSSLRRGQGDPLLDPHDIPAYVLEEITRWLDSSNSTEDHPFTRGILVLHDMYGIDSATPYMVRAVQEMVDALNALQGTAIFMSLLDISSNHPLRSALPVITGEIDPMIRYGGLAQGFIETAQSDLPAQEIVEAIMCLNVSDAELVLRLALVDRMRGVISEDREYVQYIKQIAGEIRREREKAAGENSHPAKVFS